MPNRPIPISFFDQGGDDRRKWRMPIPGIVIANAACSFLTISGRDS